MKRLPVLLACAAAVAITAGVAFASIGRSSSTGSGSQPVSPMDLPAAAPAGQMTLYGHIKLLGRVAGHVEMRLDPAWVTSGLTARRASLAETGSGFVPNDHYYVEGGHRLLTYVVAPNATIRIITNHGSGPVLTPIKLAELMRIVNGEPHRALWESLRTGVWIRVQVATIREIDQQYQP
jgi:hypothetical protein